MNDFFIGLFADKVEITYPGYKRQPLGPVIPVGQMDMVRNEEVIEFPAAGIDTVVTHLGLFRGDKLITHIKLTCPMELHAFLELNLRINAGGMNIDQRLLSGSADLLDFTLVYQPTDKWWSGQVPLYTPDTRQIAHVRYRKDYDADAVARRIAACVNACKGLSTEELELGPITQRFTQP